MKVGTDSVLLGSWCAIDQFSDTILDIGTGTGVIALMLAQRSDAMTIDAVEGDEQAFEQAVENFEKSIWKDRLYCYNATFQEFVKEIQEEEETYDLIVSNPPFYTDDFETLDLARNKARFTSSLSFEELVAGVSKILSKNGKFSVIIPCKEEAQFIAIAEENNLFVNRICRVRGNINSPVKRSLLTFSFRKTATEEAQLIIETTRHNYTEDYTRLTKDFYLKM